MWLPAPTTEMVESFRELVKKELGIELDMPNAREVATRLIIIHLMKGVLDEEAEERPGSEVPAR